MSNNNNNTMEAEGSCWEDRVQNRLEFGPGRLGWEGAEKGPPQGRSTVKRDEMQALAVLQATDTRCCDTQRWW